jgi:hypothetical protein
MGPSSVFTEAAFAGMPQGKPDRIDALPERRRQTEKSPEEPEDDLGFTTAIISTSTRLREGFDRARRIKPPLFPQGTVFRGHPTKLRRW